MIDFINQDPEVHGLIVQLPLPAHINPDKVIQQINPAKDVDGFHPVNVGRMVQGLPSYLPATPFGILKLLEHYKVETEGKNCVILGQKQYCRDPVSHPDVKKSIPGQCHSHDLPQQDAKSWKRLPVRLIS